MQECEAEGCYPPLCLPRSPPLFESGPLGLSVRECGAAGSASGQTACPFSPTLCQSGSRHGNTSPLRPSCPSPPLLPVWMNVYFLFPWCRTFLPFDFLSVLVVPGGAVCLPTPPSWFCKVFYSLFLSRIHVLFYLDEFSWISQKDMWKFPTYLPLFSPEPKTRPEQTTCFNI